MHAWEKHASEKFVTNWDLRVIMLHSMRSCRLLVHLCGILVRSVGLDFAV